MKKTKTAGRPVLGALRPLAAFEVLYKMGAVILFVPLLLGSSALVMRLNGLAYLTHENIRAFLTSPLTVLAFGMYLLLGAAYELVDICAVLFALDQAALGRTVTAGQILRFALDGAARTLRPRAIPLAAAALLLLPAVHGGCILGFFATVSVPGPIADYLRAKPLLPELVIAAGLLMTAAGLWLLYAFPCLVLEGGPARKSAAALIKGHRVRDIGAFLGVQAVCAALGVALLLAVVAAAGLVGRLLTAAFRLDWLGPFAVWLATVLTLWLIASLAVPVGYGSLGVLYLRRRAAGGQPTPCPAAPAPCRLSSVPRRDKLIKALAACAVAAGSLAIFLMLCTGAINPDVEYLHTMEITAHRGASAFFPENTMAAFVGANDLGADWIELDVQQCRDGQLVVAHDANLKRTTGVNVNVWELTYPQIAALDAGSAFGPEYAGEPIPLLADVLAFARDSGVKLNIELKPTGHETDLEKSVVDAIRQAELEDACVVTSQVYQVLKDLKAYDENITTVYVMRLAYGSIDRLSAADHFSVDAKSVTRALVSRVHNAGKQLYAWTVNTRKSINNMIDLGVDNIITDDVDLAKQCVYESRYSGLVEDYIQLIQ